MNSFVLEMLLISLVSSFTLLYKPLDIKTLLCLRYFNFSINHSLPSQCMLEWCTFSFCIVQPKSFSNVIKCNSVIRISFKCQLCVCQALTKKHTVLCKSNANDNRRILRFVLAIYRRYIRETSHGLPNVKTINQRDIGTIFPISRQDIILARLRCSDISQSKTIYRHDISLQPSSL